MESGAVDGVEVVGSGGDEADGVAWLVTSEGEEGSFCGEAAEGGTWGGEGVVVGSEGKSTQVKRGGGEGSAGLKGVCSSSNTTSWLRRRVRVTGL